MEATQSPIEALKKLAPVKNATQQASQGAVPNEQTRLRQELTRLLNGLIGQFFSSYSSFPC